MDYYYSLLDSLLGSLVTRLCTQGAGLRAGASSASQGTVTDAGVRSLGLKPFVAVGPVLLFNKSHRDMRAVAVAAESVFLTIPLLP